MVGGFFFILPLCLPLIYFLLFIHWTQFCFVLFRILCVFVSFCVHSHKFTIHKIEWWKTQRISPCTRRVNETLMPCDSYGGCHCWDRFAFNWFLIDSMKWFHSYSTFFLRDPIPIYHFGNDQVFFFGLEFSIWSSFTF